MATAPAPAANDAAAKEPKTSIKDIDDRLSLELIVALVGPVGSGCTTVVEIMGIVAAGVNTVFYVEPYSKSLALELHSDAISLSEDANDKVRFLQYEGFAPRTSLRLFSSAGRVRKTGGKFVEVNPKQAQPMFATPLDSYTTTENLVISKLNAKGDGNDETNGKA
jgi:hypothetical protein